MNIVLLFKSRGGVCSETNPELIDLIVLSHMTDMQKAMLITYGLYFLKLSLKNNEHITLCIALRIPPVFTFRFSIFSPSAEDEMRRSLSQHCSEDLRR